MALRNHVVDRATGATYPEAYSRLENAVLPSLAGPLVVTMAAYVNGGAIDAGKSPFRRDRLTIEGAELDFLRNKFAELVYLILKNRPLYKGAEDV